MSAKYKILNLYAGIGGNRALWDNVPGVEITAVEIKPDLAAEYKAYFPYDKVVVADAHQYLLGHYKEFDFIWSSPPCQSHSRTNYFLEAKGVVRYPRMELYQEIIFLSQFFKGKYCVENVVPYYEPLVPAQKIGRHLFWANFPIKKISQPKDDIGKMCGKNQKANKKPLKERNAVNSELGLHILETALGIIRSNNVAQTSLFAQTAAE